MSETRETYALVNPYGPLFMVELIDRTGKSHGYIGYRFHAPGANTACSGWNAQRLPDDPIAVIRPVDETPVKIEPTQEGKEDTASNDAKLDATAAVIADAHRKGIAISDIAPGAVLRMHKRKLLTALKLCLDALQQDSFEPMLQQKAIIIARDVIQEVSD